MTRRYSKDHEWLKMAKEGEFRCGISRYAADALGDVVYVELPEPGKQIKAGQTLAVVESVKAASDVYAPCSGVVRQVNAALDQTPELVNQDPEGEGWFALIDATDGPERQEAMMDAQEYARHCGAKDQ